MAAVEVVVAHTAVEAAVIANIEHSIQSGLRSNPQPISSSQNPPPPENHVKPPNTKNPRQSSTFAWRMSYAPTAILNTKIRESPGQTGAFAIKAVSPLERNFYP